MDFDYLPDLTDSYVRLRPMQDSDFDALYRVASDPLIWEQHPVRDRYKRNVFDQFFQSAQQGTGALVIIDNQRDTIIGSSRFHNFDAAEDEVEIGWTFLARDYWGGTVNGRIKRLMFDHAFQFVSKVILLVGPENIRSQRAIEKIGGVRRGERVDGNGQASLVYAVQRAKT